MAVIEVVREGHIATVTLNRADRRNAVNAEMMQELERVSRDFGQDEQTRVVIFRAEGRDFSVGADLSAPPSSRPAATMLMRRREGQLWLAMRIPGSLFRHFSDASFRCGIRFQPCRTRRSLPGSGF